MQYTVRNSRPCDLITADGLFSTSALATQEQGSWQQARLRCQDGDQRQVFYHRNSEHQTLEDGDMSTMYETELKMHILRWEVNLRLPFKTGKVIVTLARRLPSSCE